MRWKAVISRSIQAALRGVLALLGGFAVMVGAVTDEAEAQQAVKWVVSWTGSAQGPYPTGNPSLQPVLSFAFPDAQAGARNQTFRLIVRPTIWGRQARLRFSNVLGTKPVTFGGVFVGLQLGAATVVKGTNRPVTFAGKPSVTVAPGALVWSDPVNLAVRDPNAPELAGRKLAVSFHVAGESGPMTWHAKALQTSYVSAPDAGAKGAAEDEAAFPYSAASWFFLDAVDMRMPADSFAIATFGDSITDGTFSTMNGDDRWPDVLARRLYAAHGNKYAVVNAGIGGNQVRGPAEYGPTRPYPGGPSAMMRLDRDVLEQSGVATLIWLEGINDFSKNGNAPADEVMEAMQSAVAGIRRKRPDMTVLGATLPSALGSTNPNHGFIEQDEKRKTLNTFIRSSGIFDSVVEFDKLTLDPDTGSLKAELVPDSTAGGPGDKLHPNRAGYVAMGTAIDLATVLPKKPAPAVVSASQTKPGTPTKGR